jgi:hypothetical protein
MKWSQKLYFSSASDDRGPNYGQLRDAMGRSLPRRGSSGRGRLAPRTEASRLQIDIGKFSHICRNSKHTRHARSVNQVSPGV